MVPTAAQRVARAGLLPAFRCLAAASLLLCAAQAQAFSLDDVVGRARVLMSAPYAAPVSNLPPVFSQMQFADYQKIQPLAQRFEWRDQPTPFKLNFYHQGMQFNAPVAIHEIVDGNVREIGYDPQRFDFGNLAFDKNQTSKLGYAGFRVLYPINREGKEDEIMSFLGASYFRVIGKGQTYGLSGRGLAIDTALPSVDKSQPTAEEFPNFREFWIQRPSAPDQQLVIYALMDSPRVTGAYQFTLRPGADAVLDVKARLFMRGTVSTLGVAPLTSMFLFGPNQQSDKRNYRPAIHDSNGLAIHTGAGERLWRPLNDPRNLTVSSFMVDNPKGFGLLQRGREFSRFEDIKDRYDLRPSAWIEPQGDWGRGKVQLVEIPTADETNDNIVAFWTPEVQPQAGEALQYDYRMHWTMDEPALMDKNLAWVRQTFHTTGELLQSNLIRQPDGTTAFHIDFEGPVLAGLPPDAVVNAQVSVNANADLVSSAVERNPAINGWRVTLRMRVKDPAQAVELRAALASGNKTLSETWSYQLPPGGSAAQ
ncbi:glucan biosynthesis protein G [Variovorax fucosicus]|uniref:glucan biosynthesis protein G n=1 Tax=Variovorax fucosicus TaxID=3053517 RepID=UPI00403818D0